MNSVPELSSIKSTILPRPIILSKLFELKWVVIVSGFSPELEEREELE
jgi:hypothetical protein